LLICLAMATIVIRQIHQPETPSGSFTASNSSELFSLYEKTCRTAFHLGLSAIFMTRSAAIAAPAPSSGRSKAVSPHWADRSATCSRSTVAMSRHA
jgi:hypothetical protein